MSGENTSIYFTEDNLKKVDDARGKVKRSTLINLVLDYLDESYLKSLLQ